jgi:hypothetical protein
MAVIQAGQCAAQPHVPHRVCSLAARRARLTRHSRNHTGVSGILGLNEKWRKLEAADEEKLRIAE